MAKKLWVKFKSNRATQVSTHDCENIDDFLKACKKELSPLLDSCAPAQLSLSLTDGGEALPIDDDLSAATAKNSLQNPLFIFINVSEGSQQSIFKAIFLML